MNFYLIFVKIILEEIKNSCDKTMSDVKKIKMLKTQFFFLVRDNFN